MAIGVPTGSGEAQVSLNYLEPDKYAELMAAVGELRDGIFAHAPQLAGAWSRIAVLAESIRTAVPA
jgi:hypothetical protein